MPVGCEASRRDCTDVTQSKDTDSQSALLFKGSLLRYNVGVAVRTGVDCGV